MLTYIDVEYGANGELRRYRHPTLGIITIVTMYGRNGGADIVNLHGAIEVAKGLLRFEAWEREQEERERRRRPRNRAGRGRAPQLVMANPPLPASRRPLRPSGPTNPAA